MPALSMMNHKPTYPVITVCQNQLLVHEFVDMVNSTDKMKQKKGQNWQSGALVSDPVLHTEIQILPSDLHVDNHGDLCVSKGWLH